MAEDLSQYEYAAYHSILKALALSPASWETEEILTSLRMVLHITDEVHSDCRSRVSKDPEIVELRELQKRQSQSMRAGLQQQQPSLAIGSGPGLLSMHPMEGSTGVGVPGAGPHGMQPLMAQNSVAGSNPHAHFAAPLANAPGPRDTLPLATGNSQDGPGSSRGAGSRLSGANAWTQPPPSARGGRHLPLSEIPPAGVGSQKSAKSSGGGGGGGGQKKTLTVSKTSKANARFAQAVPASVDIMTHDLRGYVLERRSAEGVAWEQCVVVGCRKESSGQRLTVATGFGTAVERYTADVFLRKGKAGVLWRFVSPTQRRTGDWEAALARAAAAASAGGVAASPAATVTASGVATGVGRGAVAGLAGAGGSIAGTLSHSAVRGVSTAPIGGKGVAKKRKAEVASVAEVPPYSAELRKRTIAAAQASRSPMQLRAMVSTIQDYRKNIVEQLASLRVQDMLATCSHKDALAKLRSDLDTVRTKQAALRNDPPTSGNLTGAHTVATPSGTPQQPPAPPVATAVPSGPASADAKAAAPANTAGEKDKTVPAAAADAKVEPSDGAAAPAAAPEGAAAAGTVAPAAGSPAATAAAAAAACEDASAAAAPEGSGRQHAAEGPAKRPPGAAPDTLQTSETRSASAQRAGQSDAAEQHAEDASKPSQDQTAAAHEDAKVNVCYNETDVGDADTKMPGEDCEVHGDDEAGAKPMDADVDDPHKDDPDTDAAKQAPEKQALGDRAENQEAIEDAEMKPPVSETEGTPEERNVSECHPSQTAAAPPEATNHDDKALPREYPVDAAHLSNIEAERSGAVGGEGVGEQPSPAVAADDVEAEMKDPAEGDVVADTTPVATACAAGTNVIASAEDTARSAAADAAAAPKDADSEMMDVLEPNPMEPSVEASAEPAADAAEPPAVSKNAALTEGQAADTSQAQAQAEKATEAAKASTATASSSPSPCESEHSSGANADAAAAAPAGVPATDTATDPSSHQPVAPPATDTAEAASGHQPADPPADPPEKDASAGPSSPHQGDPTTDPLGKEACVDPSGTNPSSGGKHAGSGSLVGEDSPVATGAAAGPSLQTTPGDTCTPVTTSTPADTEAAVSPQGPPDQDACMEPAENFENAEEEGPVEGASAHS